MTYGIDLGTTYSLIGAGDELYTDLVSSTVDLERQAQCSRDTVGKHVKSGYKVDMTSGASGQVPIKCSSIVLKDLARRAYEMTGIPVTEAVVSVPAKFSHTQRLAVIEAGAQAGINVKAVINEPTAAAIYACMNTPGLYMIYDLGGGTFDVSIVSVSTSGVCVVCTDGIHDLAGNNFDRLVLARLCDKHRVRVMYRTELATQQMLCAIQQAKEDFQKDGMTKYISLAPYGLPGQYELTKEEYLEAMKVFEPTITLCKTLIATLMGLEEPKILFVGGSTACPYLRKWVCKELQLEHIPLNIQPDYLVAKGVAKYAWLVDNGYDIVQDVTKQLSIADSLGVAQMIIPQDTPLPAQGEILVSNPTTCRTLEVDLYQGDDCVANNNDYIGTLEFDYGMEMAAGEGIVNITVDVDVNGIVQLTGLNVYTGAQQAIKLKVR